MLATSLFAGERNRAAEPSEQERATARIPAEQPEVAPLLYQLPEMLTNDVVTLQIRILQGKHLRVQEIVDIPPGVQSNATVGVLSAHGEDLAKLREAEARKPGSLRFLVFAGQRLLTDEPFASIDARSTKLSADSAVGEVRQVDFRPEAKAPSAVRAEGVGYDQACMDDCQMRLDSCLEWCDPRGDSCNQCYTWYHDCYIFCPTVCTEPKSVKNVTTYSSLGSTYSASVCRYDAFRNPRWFDYRTTRVLVTTWQRTEHCDGSYTDVYVSSYETTTSCWSKSIQSCPFPTNGVPYPLC
jgi:hypothetical protein